MVIDKESNYYPFGLDHKGYNSSAGNSAYRYSYQGQERQEDTNWLAFKWRNYDPTIGRFFGVDILADKYQYQTPYAFSENKVINYVEWEGLEAVAPPLPVGPVPPLLPPPIYGNTETGLHPVGVQPFPMPTLNDIKEGFNRGINTLKVFITIKAVEIEQGFNNIKEGFDAIKDTWSRVLNSDKTKNPYGAKGKPDHQAKVKDLEKKAQTENPGMTIITEEKIKLEGSNRRPDVQVVDPKTKKTIKIYEAERRPSSTRNRNREAEYDRLNIPHETHKVGN